MAVTIDLVRHATSTWVKEASASPVPLFGGRMDNIPLADPEGRDEAAELGRYGCRNGIRPTLVVSSTARRALQTYQFSAPELRCRLVAVRDRRLVEMSWGRWTGQPWSIASTDTVKQAKARLGFGFTPPAGESFDTVRARVMKSILEHAQNAPDGSHIWMYTHRNAIKAVVRQWMSEWTPANISAAALDVASLTRLRYERGRLSLVFFNQPTLSGLR
jgi:broad specificity phosphatase PhoE